MENLPHSSSDLQLNFPTEVVKAIQEILPSDDPFDSPDFNSIDYINEKFPAEQSLHQIDDILEKMRLRISSIDDEIRYVVRSLTNVEQDGRSSLINAQDAISELFSRFSDIKERASESEDRVKEITRDIKQLDVAKRNLTTSITTLNHLQMLVEGVDKLTTLKIQREYGEIATLLQGVGNVLDHLKKYKHIPQVSDLSGQVEQIRKDLEKQITDDFHSVFHGSNAKRFAPSKELAEACLVLSVLDYKVKNSVLSDIIQIQLAEYDVLFSPSEKDGWLDKVELRRKWFLKAAVEFEKSMAAIFPPSWQVSALLALSFCEITYKQLTNAMELRAQDIDVSMLLHAHKVMSEFEILLSRKYHSFKLPSERKKSLPSYLLEETKSLNPFELESSKYNLEEVATSGETLKKSSNLSPFIGSICKAFIPFLHIYLQNVDKRLMEQVEKFSTEMKQYRFEQINVEASNVVPFCGELFTIYKNILVEFLRLGIGENLNGLAEVMQKYLREFGNNVLRSILPKLGTTNLLNMPKDLNMKELTAVLAQVQTLWNENDTPKLTELDLRKVCSVLVSSEYCEEMTAKLESKLREKTEGVSTISFAVEQDLFHAVLTQSIALLVAHVESQCEASLAVMPKINWILEQTGDQSPYVTAISQHISTTVPIIRYNLHTSRKYFTRFCDKLAATIINKFIQQIYKCRPINTVGCEQLLLDCHALKTIILALPIVETRVQRDPPQAYTRMVNRAMSRAELFLQVVMAEYADINDIVDKFIRLLPDASMMDFQKVLELRGIKERAPILEVYRKRMIENSNDHSYNDSASNLKLANISFSTSTASPERDSSKIARLERMLKSRRLMT